MKDCKGVWRAGERRPFFFFFDGEGVGKAGEEGIGRDGLMVD